MKVNYCILKCSLPIQTCLTRKIYSGLWISDAYQNRKNRLLKIWTILFIWPGSKIKLRLRKFISCPKIYLLWRRDYNSLRNPFVRENGKRFFDPLYTSRQVVIGFDFCCSSTTQFKLYAIVLCPFMYWVLLKVYKLWRPSLTVLFSVKIIVQNVIFAECNEYHLMR
jgi:hypothetical protein